MRKNKRVLKYFLIHKLAYEIGLSKEIFFFKFQITFLNLFISVSKSAQCFYANFHCRNYKIRLLK